MDCGIPFCHNGCPLGNLIPGMERPGPHRPVARGHRAAARDQQFPRVHRPALPGAVRVILRAGHQPGRGDDQADRGRDHRQRLRRGLGGPVAAGGRPAHRQEGRRGGLRSGRSGRRAAADPGRTRGDGVRARRPIGGLLRYGIPEFKMEKRHLDRRLEQMEAEGTVFRAGVNVGVDITRRGTAVGLRRGGAGRRCDRLARPADPRPRARRHLPGDGVPALGEPGQYGDVLGESTTSRRSRPRARRSSSSAAVTPAPTAWAPPTVRAPSSVHQFEIMPRPPETRADVHPVADLPDDVSGLLGARRGRRAGVLGQHRGVRRRGRPRHRAARCTRSRQQAASSSRPRAATSTSRPTWCCWRWASSARSSKGLLTDLGVELTDRGNVTRNNNFETSVPGVFVAGDTGRGQSLIVWAIAEGRAAAAGVDRFLMGETALPAPIMPTAAPQR